MRDVQRVSSTIILAVGLAASVASPAAGQLVTISSGTTGASTLSGDVAYDPSHDVFLFVHPGTSVDAAFPAPPVTGRFVNGYGNTSWPLFTIGPGGPIITPARAIYSPDLDDGAGGAGAFLVVWSSQAYPEGHLYVQVVAFPNRLVGPPVVLDQWSTSPRGSSLSPYVPTVDVAYSAADHVFLIAWEVRRLHQSCAITCWNDTQIEVRFRRLNQQVQTVGNLATIGGAVVAKQFCVLCGMINVVWNPASNEFGVLYDDASVQFARVRPDGSISSVNSFGPPFGAASTAHALAVNTGTGSYLAVVADTTTRTYELDTSGAVQQSHTPLPIGLTDWNDQVAMSYSPTTNTYLLDSVGLCAELDEHGAPRSPSFPLGTWRTPAIANRSGVAQWMVTTAAGFVRVATSVTPPYVRGDFTFDGIPDLIGQQPTTGETMLWEMDVQQGPFVQYVPIGGPTTWKLVTAADITGDKKSDWLWQSPTTGEVLLWEMNGPAYIRSWMLTNGGTSWRLVSAADITGDGQTDLLWQMPGSGAVLLWVMDGPTYAASIILNPGGTYWQVVGAADFTGDGQTDILWQHPASGALLLWTMNGTTYAGSLMLTTGGTYWRVAAVGDYVLGDGKPDIIWQLPADGSVLLWTMNGTSYVTSSLISGPTLWEVKGPR